MEKISDLEQQLNINTDLLAIARDYCEFNHDKDSTISTLFSLLEIVLANQRKLMAEFDKVNIF